MSGGAVFDEADQRFAIDPVFRARVTATVDLISEHHRRVTGIRLDEVDRSLAQHAASIALVLAGLVPS